MGLREEGGAWEEEQEEGDEFFHVKEGGGLPSDMSLGRERK
jgi:hypothetical protein